MTGGNSVGQGKSLCKSGCFVSCFLSEIDERMVWKSGMIWAWKVKQQAGAEDAPKGSLRGTQTLQPHGEGLFPLYSTFIFITKLCAFFSCQLFSFRSNSVFLSSWCTRAQANPFLSSADLGLPRGWSEICLTLQCQLLLQITPSHSLLSVGSSSISDSPRALHLWTSSSSWHGHLC